MINNRQLYRLLKDNGIEHLHHANTVATSITFLERGGLLSRGAVERLNLIQTTQQSDRKDKIYDVWNDVFLDMYDLHGKFPRQNYYGPVLFKISIDFLLNTSYEIRITKSNPMSWSPKTKYADKYFRNVQELKSTWRNYAHQKRMVTLRNNQRPALFNYLQEILVDSPGQSEIHLGIYRKAIRHLKAIDQNLKSKITRKKCDGCFCKENYAQYHPSRLRKMFSPLA